MLLLRLTEGVECIRSVDSALRQFSVEHTYCFLRELFRLQGESQQLFIGFLRIFLNEFLDVHANQDLSSGFVRQQDATE